MYEWVVKIPTQKAYKRLGHVTPQGFEQHYRNADLRQFKKLLCSIFYLLFVMSIGE